MKVVQKKPLPIEYIAPSRLCSHVPQVVSALKEDKHIGLGSQNCTCKGPHDAEGYNIYFIIWLVISILSLSYISGKQQEAVAFKLYKICRYMTS